jgi:hypothetical protein
VVNAAGFINVTAAEDGGAGEDSIKLATFERASRKSRLTARNEP